MPGVPFQQIINITNYIKKNLINFQNIVDPFSLCYKIKRTNIFMSIINGKILPRMGL